MVNNNVTLIGRLTKDPEARYTQAAEPMAIARYTLAVDRRKVNETGADFISCISFGKTAEFAEKYFRKGIKIGLRGHIQTGSYTKDDGTKVYTTDVVVDEQMFVESKASAESNNAPAEQSTPKAESNGFVFIPDGMADDELPFD